MTEPSPDLLYNQGMAHYQRREWRAALDKFKQLKSVEPDWPGLEPLIDEVSWFLKLEEVGDSAQVPPIMAEPQRRTQRLRLSWLALVALIVVVLAGVAVRQDWMPRLSPGRSVAQESLYNRGQASLAVGDYQAAREAFSELAQAFPNDPAIQEGLQRAARLEQLALAYQAAQAAMTAEDWATAESHLRDVLALDPVYQDASEQLSMVERRRRAAELYAAAVIAYDNGNSAQAIEKFERLMELDPDYQRTSVRELLFVLYLNDGQALLATPDANANTIRQAIGRFGQALALRPRNVQAAEESRLANLFLSARQAIDQQSWAQAESLLSSLLQQRANYADGEAARWLYQVLVRLGEEALAAGRTADAREIYEQALALPAQAIADRSAAEIGLRAAAAAQSSTPTPPTASAPATPFVVVEAPTLNVRLGPSTDYPTMGQVAAGDRLELVGRNDAGDWLVVCCVNGQPGWVAARLVSPALGVTIEQLPVGLAPTRPPQPTPTPTSTATPTVTPTILLPSPTPQANSEPPPTATKPPR